MVFVSERPGKIVSSSPPVKGANASALEKEIGPEQFPVNEHYFGLVNVGDRHVSGTPVRRHRPLFTLRLFSLVWQHLLL